MKKQIVIACVIAIMSAAADAGAAGWTGGIKGGVNMADLTGDDGPENTSTRNGLAGGLFARTDLNERFGFQGEVLYIQKGAEGEFTIPGDDHPHESIVKLDYVEVPLLFTATFPAGEKFAFSLFAGPTLGFNMTAEVEVVDHNETEELDTVEDFEFGGAVGGGIEYKLSSVSLLADVRYGVGFTSVVGDVAGQSVDVKNNGIAIMAGLAFGIGQ
jgi:hypothetical protein